MLIVGCCERYKKKRNHRIWKKTGGVCAHCGCRAVGRNKTIDHYIPRSWGGGYDSDNLVPLCKRCNQERGNRRIRASTYYVYAPLWVIERCEEYERRWGICRHRMRVQST